MFTHHNWMPLISQQLRLRNVIKIVGENIQCNLNKSKYHCRIYYTLHHHLNDPPIYTSELVTLVGNGNANWDEINCDVINKTPCRSICIKVWEKSCELNDSLCSESDSAKTINKIEDHMLFVWGLNFPGLILIPKQSEIKFQPNTLIFKMHGSYFTSPTKLKNDCEHSNQQEIQKNYSNISHSYKRHSKPTYDAASNTFRENIYSKSELTSGKDDLNINKNCDIRNSSENINKSLLHNLSSSPGIQSTQKKTNIRILKARYHSKNLNLNEIHTSYDLEKLLEIQKQQRKMKVYLKDINEVSEHICLRSSDCINMELMAKIKPGAIYHNYNKSKNSHSMGRTLNRLLFQEAEIKPEEVLKAQGLRKQIENARFRLQILNEEKQRLINNCKQLEKKFSECSNENLEMKLWIISRSKNLQKEQEFLLKENVELIEKKEILMKTQAILRQVKSQFCGELKEIFQVQKRANNKYTICKIYLPNSDEICETGNSHDSIFVVVPTSLSSALGYVAHVVQMCSIVLDVPLRNPIKCEGSRSKIFYTVKEIPNTSRIFPLYCTTYPPQKSVLYAIYLLNQNIAQLNLQSNGIDFCDPRKTLENLLQLLNGPNIMGNFLLQLPNSDEPNDNLNLYSSRHSVSSSSTDLNLVTIPSGIADGKSVDSVDYIMRIPSTNIVNDQRISRSVGSYSDDDLSVAGDKTFFNSEPILTAHSIAVHLENVAKNENF